MSGLNNLHNHNDEPEQRKSKEDKASSGCDLTANKKLVAIRKRKQDKHQGFDKFDDFVQTFSQLTNQEVEVSKHMSVDVQQQSKATEKNRENIKKKSIPYHKNVASYQSDTNASRISQCYYTDVIDLINESMENGEHVLNQVSYYKPEPVPNHDVEGSSETIFKMRTKRLNETIESRKSAVCKLTLPCIPDIKKMVFKSFNNQNFPGPVSQYTMNREPLKCSISGKLKGLVKN